ncbi:MAG: sulfurtransferase TusA family protein [Azospirillum sp.]|nr:sulfurtransferase TusA family protein [Azospirillum sp.]
MTDGNIEDYFLDITGEVCPLTFVRTKLLIERIPSGAILEVRLRGAEPLANVPRAIAELGHQVLGLTAESDPAPAGDPVHRLRVRKT